MGESAESIEKEKKKKKADALTPSASPLRRSRLKTHAGPGEEKTVVC